MRAVSVLLVCAAFLGGRFSAAHSAVLVAPDSPGVAAPGGSPRASLQEVVRNIRGLLAAVRGLSPVVCGLTAEAASGWGGRWFNAPAPPLGEEAAERVASFPRGRMSLSEITLVVDSLSTTDACVREVALRLVGRAPAAVVEERLIARVSSAATPVATREAAALGLGLVRSRAAIDPLLRLSREPEVGLRANSVWALGRIGDKRAAPALRRMLADEEDLVRRAAVDAVGVLEDEDSVQELLRVLRSDRVARVRRSAAWALGQIEARAAADGLVAAVRTERDEDVREMCVWALGPIEARSATGALSELLRRDTNAEVREMAAWALGEIEDVTAAAALGEAAGSDQESEVRGTASWALGQLEVREAPPGLIRAITDADEDVRTRAAWALSEIGDARAASALRDAFRRERDATARKAQLRALVKVGERSEEFLRELLRSDDPEIREAAVRGMAGRHSNPWPWPMPRPRPYP